MMSCVFQRQLKKLYVAFVLGSLLSCVAFAQTVTTSRAAGVDFSKFHTYKWVEVKGPHPDPSVDAQIRGID